MSLQQTQLRLANFALQMVGQDPITTLTDDSKAATEIARCYDAIRLYELRRNPWRFAIRRTVLRAVDSNTMTPVVDNFGGSATPYDLFNDGQGQIYQALEVTTTAPGADIPGWQVYFGPRTVTLFDPTTTYRSGELVYSAGNSGSATVFLSLADFNKTAPLDSIGDWDDTTTYSQGDRVIGSDGNTYQALVSDLLNKDPTGTVQYWVQVNSSWKELTSVDVAAFAIVYPIGTGPSDQTVSRNVFALPFGYLREAAQNPKAGAPYAPLGGPVYGLYSDWEYEGNYITSNDPGPILFRFGADIEQVAEFDPMFYNALACRVALQICEPLTQSNSKLQNIGAELKQFMSEARLVNGIELGPVDPPEDEFVAVRI